MEKAFDFSSLIQYIPFVVPLVLIQLGMAVYALVDLSRRQNTRGPRWLWALLLIITAGAFPSGVIVSGIYLAWGRNIEA